MQLRGAGIEGWPWKSRGTLAVQADQLTSAESQKRESDSLGLLSSAMVSLSWPKCVFECMGSGEELWLWKCPGGPSSVKESSS